MIFCIVVFCVGVVLMILNVYINSVLFMLNVVMLMLCLFFVFERGVGVAASFAFVEFLCLCVIFVILCFGVMFEWCVVVFFVVVCDDVFVRVFWECVMMWWSVDCIVFRLGVCVFVCGLCGVLVFWWVLDMVVDDFVCKVCCLVCEWLCVSCVLSFGGWVCVFCVFGRARRLSCGNDFDLE